MLLARLQQRGAIIVSHNMALLRRVCDAAVVFEAGRAQWFDDVGPAIRQHHKNMDVSLN